MKEKMAEADEIINWRHPEDDADEWDGFNHSGIEHFLGNPLFSIGREICQNALDASDGSGMVTVDFKLQTIPINQLPDVDGFRETVSACSNEAQNESEKAKNFFKKAKKEINSGQIKVLQISDYQTNGMKGPSVNGTPFYAFMKAKGQSKKDDDAAGSFGIGQFAAFSVSKFRTIFVSTVCRLDTGELEQFTQGKSILMSHKSGELLKRGVGYWGVEDRCRPVVGTKDYLQFWQRADSEDDYENNIGTTISIIGFDEKENWDWSLFVSIAESFFGAINDGRLRVIIDGRKLDQDSIGVIFEHNNLIELIENNKLESRKNALSKFSTCRKYFECMKKNENVIVENSQRRELGNCELRIVLSEEGSKSVAILRKGMTITDELDGLKSFPTFKNFTAVFFCKNRSGNELLRLMEPPKHDYFEPERLGDDHPKGKKVLKDIQKWVREMLVRHAKEPVTETTEITELRDYFPEEGSGGDGKSLDEINPFGDMIIRAKPLKLKGLSPTQLEFSFSEGEDDADVPDEDGILPEPPLPSPHPDPPIRPDQPPEPLPPIPGQGDENDMDESISAQIKFESFRNLILEPDKRRIYFTPVGTGKVKLGLLMSGADSDYPLKVVSCSKGSVDQGEIYLEVTDGERVDMEVQLNQEFNGALTIRSNR